MSSDRGARRTMQLMLMTACSEVAYNKHKLFFRRDATCYPSVLSSYGILHIVFHEGEAPVWSTLAVKLASPSLNLTGHCSKRHVSMRDRTL
jgi:hypothetical protein